jgi:hypothetical protein
MKAYFSNEKITAIVIKMFRVDYWCFTVFPFSVSDPMEVDLVYEVLFSKLG